MKIQLRIGSGKSAYQQEAALAKQGTVLPPKKRLCKYCHKVFKCGKALGGHIRIHNKKYHQIGNSGSHLCRYNNSFRNEAASSQNIDLSQFVSEGWKVHKKRGSRKRQRSNSEETADTNETERLYINESEQDEVDCNEPSDQEEQEMEMLEGLKETYGYSELDHKICKTEHRKFVCVRCNVNLPTFHAVALHVNEAVSTIENAEEEQGGAGASGEGQDEKSDEESVKGQVTANSTPESSKNRDFDLNELPPVDADVNESAPIEKKVV